MARPYGEHNLTPEQKKLVEDNLPFVWYYFKRKVQPRYKHLGDNEVDEVLAQMYFFFCQAAEKWDPERGAFSTCAVLYMKSGINALFKGKEVFDKKHILSPFQQSDESDEDGYFIGEELADKREAPTNVKWDKLTEIFHKANLTEEEISIINLKYNEGYQDIKIADMIGKTRERVRQIVMEAILKIRRVTSAEKCELEDFL
jgi:RNA polymerase sigma factor (sigma-70 family)